MPLRPLLVPVVGLAVVAALSSSCTGSPPAEAYTIPPQQRAHHSPSPSPTPDPVEPVHGSVLYEGVRLDRSGSKLFVSGSPRDARPALDEQAMRDFIGSVARTLDLHLTALQAGEPATLPAPLDAATAPAAARAATTDLTSPDAPVTEAVYDVAVAIDATAHWATVTARVTRADGSVRAADFVFVATPDGPQMIAAGPTTGGAA